MSSDGAQSAANVRADAESLTLPELWARVMNAVERMPGIAVATEPMRPLERRGSTLRVAAPASHARMFTEYQRGVLEGVIEQQTGSRLRVEVVPEAAPAPSADDSASGASVHGIDAAARAKAMQHPVVMKASELFEARLLRIEPAE